MNPFEALLFIIGVLFLIVTLLLFAFKRPKKKEKKPPKILSPLVVSIIESMEYAPENWAFCKNDYLENKTARISISPHNFGLSSPRNVAEFSEAERKEMERAYTIMRTYKNPERIKGLIAELREQIENKKAI